MPKRKHEGFTLTRPTYKDRRGEAKESTRWHVRFRDHNGAWRRLTAYTDKQASNAFGERLRRLTDLRAAGEPMPRDIAEWLDGQPADVIGKLSEWDVVDRRAQSLRHSIAEHLEEWRKSILHDGRTMAHADLVHRRAENVIEGCGFARFTDIDEEAVKAWLAGEVKADRMSKQTRNHYVRALKQFCAWMVAQRRVTYSPVAGLKMQTVVETDRKHPRRSLSEDDLLTLLQTTHKGGRYGRLSGQERSLLYWLAAETGFRAAELRSLTRSSFDLEADPPSVLVKAAYSKNRREHRLALSGELAAQLRTHLAKKLPTAPAFFVPSQTSRMLRADLETAGIPYEQDGEFFDFHSLRVQCGTDMARGGAIPAVAQARMRHSDIRLTMGIYTKLNANDQAAALQAIPARRVS